MKDMSKEHKILLFIVLLLAIGVGYALLTVNLRINGTASITDGRWNIHFENYQQTVNSTISPTSGNAPVITGDTTTEISYTVDFQEPGDVYEFTIDIVNGGTMDATVISLDKTVKIQNVVQTTIPTYLDYSVTYSNGNPYTIPHALVVDGTDSILVRVEFKRDITATQLAEVAGKSLSFTLKPVFVQGDGSVPDFTYLYAYDGSFEVGDSIKDEDYVYNDFHEFQERVFLRLKLRDGIIEDINIGYLYKWKLYYVPSYEIGNSEQFHETALVLRSIYGGDRCVYDTGNSLSCPGFYLSKEDPLDLTYGTYYCAANDGIGKCNF